MTAQLTIKDLNCGNCNHYKRVEKHDGISITRYRVCEFLLLNTTHCASHPLALQVLAAPTIEELEKEEKEQIGMYQNATTMNEEVYHQGIVFGIQRAAKLLKEGVKKL